MALMDRLEALVADAASLAEQALADGKPQLALLCFSFMSEATEWVELECGEDCGGE